MNSRPELKLAFCDHKAATYAVMNWHYSKRMPSGKLVHVGVWESGKFIGVVIFGRGAVCNIGSPFGLGQEEVCELVRIALTTHSAPVSQIVAVALRLLKQSSDGLRLIVSYADPDKAHHGGIYQAMNWVYAGLGASDTKYLDDAGNEWHRRAVSPSGYAKQFGVLRKVRKAGDLTAVKVSGKHKYLYPLDDAMRQQIQPLAKPYPKRVGSVDSDTLGYQPIIGGANPTPTPQE